MFLANLPFLREGSGERAPRRSQEYGGNHTVGFAFDLGEASESRRWDGYPTV